jgi:glutamine synthetase
VLDRAAERGYTAHFSAEYEFFIFRETAQSLRDKHFTALTPLTPGMFGYSVLRASANAELVLEIMEGLAAFDVPLEGFHTETGPGVYEAAIAVEPGLAAADRAALFKVAVKEIAGTAQPDADVHGQMERQPAGFERASASEPQPAPGTARTCFPARRRMAACRRSCGSILPGW